MNRRPVLVTGMPRAGTTWLARLVATAPGTALAGREPMNPRGRQYGLGRTLTGWAQLSAPTARQRRALRSAYAGRNPWVFSRYGHRQWLAPWPGTRVVVKDPFAMLSLPVIAATTAAQPILLYRHPGAALLSYRRMGWEPDLDELRPVLAAHRASRGSTGPDLPAAGDHPDPVVAMGLFWSALYEIALDDAAQVPGLLVVSHEELAAGGQRAAARLLAALDLSLAPAGLAMLAPAGGGRESDPVALHNLGRNPAEVAGQWRARLSDAEAQTLEATCAPVLARLAAARFSFG